MFFINRSKFLMILFLAVVSGREDRDTVSFYAVSEISIGYSEWNIVSLLNTLRLREELESLQDGFEKLSWRKKYYLKSFRKGIGGFKKLKEVFYEGFWEKEFAVLEDLKAEASEHVENVELFAGVERKARRKRRSVLNIATKAASSVYKAYRANSKTKKFTTFEERFQHAIDLQKSSLQDVFNYADSQLSFNREAENQITRLSSDISDLTSDLNEFLSSESTQQHMEHITSQMKAKYQDLIDFCKNIMQGIIQGSKGLPHPPFLSPKSISDALDGFSDKRTVDKSYYNQEKILELYDTVVTRVEQDEGYITLINTVRIPTRSTRATIRRMETFPVYLENEDKFIQVQSEFPYLVTSPDGSKFMRFTQNDLNLCDKLSHITLCPLEVGNWQPRHHGTCESAQYFQDEDVNELCNFKTIEKKDVTNVKQTAIGEYHYSFDTKKSVSVTCTGKAKGESGIRHLELNGFITLTPACVASVPTESGTDVLRNYISSNRFEPVHDQPHAINFNVEKIINLKQLALKSSANEDFLEKSLTNEGIRDEFREAAKEKKTDAHIAKLEEGYKKLAKSVADDRIKSAKGYDKIVKKYTEKQSYTKSKSNVVLGVSVAALALCLFFFCFCIYVFCVKRKQSS